MSRINQKCPKLIPSNCRLPGSTNFQLCHHPFCKVSFPVNPNIMHSSIIKIIHSQIILLLTALVSRDDDRSKAVALRLDKFQGDLKKSNSAKFCTSCCVKPIFLPSLFCAIKSMYILTASGVIISFPGDNVLLGRDILFTKIYKYMLNNQRNTYPLWW